MKHYKHRDDCRLCGSTKFELVLPILPSAIGDAFVSKDQLDVKQDLYPLDTYLCLDCGHLQNLDVVNPELLFCNYTYRTSASIGLVDHFKKYAHTVVSGLNIPPSSFVVEIGSNDGSLLKEFKVQGMRVLGVDPAGIIASQASSDGIKTLSEFFTHKVALRILAENECAKLICANNVFAHVDNINDIAKGIRSLLAPDGVFIFEVSYVPDIIDNFLFDTIYHEHLSYHALIPLERFFNSLDMTLFDVERVSTKGGSIRGYAQPMSTGTRQKTESYFRLLDAEQVRGFSHPEIYRIYYQSIENRKNTLLEYVDQEIGRGKTVAAYGASTTTTTLLYHFELQNRISFILDDNPLKINLYSPGAHIPVFSASALYEKSPDFVIILAWQYSDLIIKKHAHFIENGGCFLTPLPDLKIN